MASRETLELFVGKKVVIDTDSPNIYLGVIESVNENSVVLVSVDVHDSKDTISTKDVYIMDTAQHGVRDNRKKVHLCLSRIVSISELDDIKIF